MRPSLPVPRSLARACAARTCRLPSRVLSSVTRERIESRSGLYGASSSRAAGMPTKVSCMGMTPPCGIRLLMPGGGGGREGALLDCLG